MGRVFHEKKSLILFEAHILEHHCYTIFYVILDVEKEQPNNDIGTPLLSGNGRSQSRIDPPATPFSDMNFIDGTENR